MPIARINDHDMYFEVLGQGEPVLCFGNRQIQGRPLTGPFFFTATSRDLQPMRESQRKPGCFIPARDLLATFFGIASPRRLCFTAKV